MYLGDGYHLLNGPRSPQTHSFHVPGIASFDENSLKVIAF